MKTKVILVSLIVLVTLLAGCSQPATTDNETSSDANTDVVTTASLVDNQTAFQNAISAEGTWIIATTKDLTFDQGLVLDGTFLNGKKDDSGADITQRKIAPYTQDEERNVTARFVITAPSLTINSPEASFEHATFVGDIYVNAANFQLKDAKVTGNIYFSTAEIQATFKMDDKSSVSGVQEVSTNTAV